MREWGRLGHGARGSMRNVGTGRKVGEEAREVAMTDDESAR